MKDCQWKCRIVAAGAVWYDMVWYGMVPSMQGTSFFSLPCHNTIPHASQCNHTMMRHAIPCHTMQYYSSCFLIHTWLMPHDIIRNRNSPYRGRWQNNSCNNRQYVQIYQRQCPNNLREARGRKGGSSWWQSHEWLSCTCSCSRYGTYTLWLLQKTVRQKVEYNHRYVLTMKSYLKSH